MSHTVAERIRRWSREYTPSDLADDSNNPQFLRIESQIDYLCGRLYSEYEVTKYPPFTDFPYRLRDWLDSAPDEDDQKVLFQMVPKIFFIGSHEYASLYRAAFNGPIARWLIDQVGLNIDDETIQAKIRNEIKSTWFCAITDSMQIARFYHINNIEGTDLRPDWRVLNTLSTKYQITDFMNKEKLKRIVLLEDFVGSGSQMSSAVNFAATLPNDCPILLCPLIICPSGFNKGVQLENNYPGKVTFDPALVLDSTAILHKTPQQNEDPLNNKFREIVVRLYGRVEGTSSGILYGPYGFSEHVENGGLLVVLYTNCPDNTLPIIHHKSDTPWHPLFPRSSRL